jgi:hypothetical protein
MASSSLVRSACEDLEEPRNRKDPENSEDPVLGADQRLCKRCGEFEKSMLRSQTKDTRVPEYHHYQYFGQICTAARLGCYLCNILEQGLLYAQVGGVDTRDAICSVEDARTFLLGHDKHLASMSDDERDPDWRYLIRLSRETFIGDDLSSLWEGFSSFRFKRVFRVKDKREMEAYFMLCVLRGE